jgi:CxxC motif-containing protein (DUF1111 family)
MSKTLVLLPNAVFLCQAILTIGTALDGMHVRCARFQIADDVSQLWLEARSKVDRAAAQLSVWYASSASTPDGFGGLRNLASSNEVTMSLCHSCHVHGTRGGSETRPANAVVQTMSLLVRPCLSLSRE